jgi:hypothetical protein
MSKDCNARAAALVHARGGAGVDHSSEFGLSLEAETCLRRYETRSARNADLTTSDAERIESAKPWPESLPGGEYATPRKTPFSTQHSRGNGWPCGRHNMPCGRHNMPCGCTFGCTCGGTRSRE